MNLIYAFDLSDIGDELYNKLNKYGLACQH